MKKLICIFLSAVILFTLVSCGSAEPQSSGEIDIDLSAMSGTMVYSEVYNMMVDPDSYEGKTIKAYGDKTKEFNTVYNEYERLTRQEGEARGNNQETQ